MSNQTQDSNDVFFTTSDSPPSSLALVQTCPASPCSPVTSRPNFFLPRICRSLAVTQAVKGNAKDHNVSTFPADAWLHYTWYILIPTCQEKKDHISDKLIDKKFIPILGCQPHSPSPEPPFGGDENIPPMSHPRKCRRQVTKEERNEIVEMSERLCTAWDGRVIEGSAGCIEDNKSSINTTAP